MVSALTTVAMVNMKQGKTAATVLKTLNVFLAKPAIVTVSVSITVATEKSILVKIVLTVVSMFAVPVTNIATLPPKPVLLNVVTGKPTLAKPALLAPLISSVLPDILATPAPASRPVPIHVVDGNVADQPVANN